MASVYNLLRGTLETIFKIGTVQFKDNSGQAQVRNSDDSAYARLAIAAGTANEDAVTLKQLKSVDGICIVRRQADCSAALPNNTATKATVVVTTAGTGAAIGDLLYDDGSSAGTMSIVAAIEGTTILVTDALAGGTIALNADTLYTWDADGSAWKNASGGSYLSGAVRVIEYALDNSAQQDSTNAILANSRILERRVVVTTPYSAGATITLGYDTDEDAIITAANGVNLQAAGEYVITERAAWKASDAVIRATIAGGPAAGVGKVMVQFCSALA